MPNESSSSKAIRLPDFSGLLKTASVAQNYYSVTAGKQARAWQAGGFTREGLSKTKDVFSGTKKWFDQATSLSNSYRKGISEASQAIRNAENANSKGAAWDVAGAKAKLKAAQQAQTHIASASQYAKQKFGVYQPAFKKWDDVFAARDKAKADYKAQQDALAAQVAAGMAEQDRMLAALMAEQKEKLAATQAGAQADHDKAMALKQAQAQELRMSEAKSRLSKNQALVMRRPSDAAQFRKKSKGVKRFQVSLNTGVTMGGNRSLGVPV